MQQMLSQPITQQPVDPFMQQMAAHTHKNSIIHLLSQLHQVSSGVQAHITSSCKNISYLNNYDMHIFG
jgi:hypothetical protein